MRRILAALLLILASLPGGNAAQDAVRVFIVAGQSNAVGFNDAKEYKRGRVKFPATYRHQPNILFWSAQRNDGWANLRIAKSGSFGPEISFAHDLAADLKGERIAIIKCAAGGTGIARSVDYTDYIPALKGFDDHGNNWHPPAEGRDAGILYQRLTKTTHDALAALDRKQIKWKLEACLWIQGEHEAGISRKMAEDYDKLLSNFITALRQDLKAPSLPFAIGEINSHTWAYGELAREKQAKVCREDRNVVLIKTGDLPRKGSGGASHFDADGMIALGSRFAKAIKAMTAKAGIESPAASTYYLDPDQGHDNNSGLSANSAWQSLAKLEGIEFEPGDKILLKAGETFAGKLHPRGSGAAGKPIVIDRYGEGADPVVAGGGKIENTIRLHNQHHWEIRNLTVTNTDGGGWDDEGRKIRRAVYVTAEDAGDIEHIHLENLKIRDVRGMYRFKGNLTNGGIICQVTGKSNKTRFVDLRIENCTFRTNSIDRYPVVVTSSWQKEPACELVWKNNSLDHTGRAHIVMPADQWPRELVYYFDPEGPQSIPIMRGSAVYNWREKPIITRGRDGTITRNKVTYTTAGHLFYD